MKKYLSSLILVIAAFVANNAAAAFVSGSTGADGAFNPAVNTTVTLPASGILNYTTVTIPTGITVTFKKNAANTPVYILATGDVTITGAIKADGGTVVYSAIVSTTPGFGGAGGYNGGYGGGANNMPGGKGMGPGGGGGGPSGPSYLYGGGGGFAVAGGSQGAGYGAGGPAYGNARIVPLVGGSGGGGGAGSAATASYGGGGGGGAILIASSTSIIVNATGFISANGGDGYQYSGGGSGGAIRLIANTITGAGNISAKGGSLNSTYKGGPGRIRLEATTNTFTSGTDPQYSYGQPATVFASSTPSLKLTTIAGVAVPATPTGSYAQPDLLLASTTTNPVTVAISAANIPTGTTVAVSVTPQFGASTSVNAVLSGTNAASTATASVTLSSQYSNVITAQATFTLLASLYYEDERIDKVRVASTFGKEPETTYITQSGKEIPAERLILAGLVK